MKWLIGCIFCALCFTFPATSFGQKWVGKKPKVCTNHPTVKGKYKILSHGLGVELQIDLEIKQKYRTDENYITIAKEFRERYCEEKKIRITYFESKEQWKLRDPFDLKATPLAIAYMGKGTDQKDGISVYTIVEGKVETRTLKID